MGFDIFYHLKFKKKNDIVNMLQTLTILETYQYLE